MLPRRLEPLPKQPPKLLQRLALHPTQDLNILKRQLKRRRLETDVPRRIREHEPEVDMDEVAVAIEEDVAVVSVFDLEEVTNDGVACVCLLWGQLRDTLESGPDEG